MERWPPIYDAEQLRDQIRNLVRSGDLENRFYTDAPAISFCQGDVFALKSPIPVIDQDGDPAAVDEVAYWIAAGNTCDFSRTLDDVLWTQLVPILDLGEKDGISPGELLRLRSYEPFRTFYVPPWSKTVGDRVLVADLTRPVGVHKTAISAVAKREARLSREGWILFHSCLVRFLARDDGRHDG